MEQSLISLELILLSWAAHFLLQIMKFWSDEIRDFYKFCACCSDQKPEQIAKASKGYLHPCLYTNGYGLTLWIPALQPPPLNPLPHGQSVTTASRIFGMGGNGYWPGLLGWAPVGFGHLCTSAGACQALLLIPPAKLLSKIQPWHGEISEKLELKRDKKWTI